MGKLKSYYKEYVFCFYQKITLEKNKIKKDIINYHSTKNSMKR